MICAIAGATGLVGNELLKLLLDDIQITQVISIGRRTLDSDSPKLKQVQASLNNLESVILPKIDMAFCCLGSTIKKAGSQQAFKEVDHDFVVNFAKKTQVAGAKSFSLISALGADSNSKIFYNKVKGQAEDSLKRLNFDTLNIFQPSLLLGHRKEKRASEELFIRLFPIYRPLFSGPLKRYRPIHVEQVANSMLKFAKLARPGIHVISNGNMLDVY